MKAWTDEELRAGRPSPEAPPDSRGSHGRRRLHLCRQSGREAPRGASGAPLRPSHLETEHLVPSEARQQVTTDDPPRAEDRPIYSNLPDSTGGKSLTMCHTQAGKREDIITLRKHLGHTRRLASAIKRGQSYFYLLQKEEREEQEEEERRRMRREEQLRTEPRPPSFSSDSDSDSEGWPLGRTGAGPGRKKSQSARPFTPVHHSLTSPLLSEAPRQVIYRQLCCLSWLLEALTLDCSGRVGPLTACWDPKDPGRGRTSIKTLRKERAIENKWEQFVSTKPRRPHPRRPHSSSARHRKSSFATVASSAAGSSLSSLAPGPEDATESGGDGPTFLRALTTPESKTCRSPRKADDKPGSRSKAKSFRPKSCPAELPSTISHLINGQASRLRELRAAFDERAEETAQSYVDVLRLRARQRLNCGLQRYQALCHMTESHHPPHHVTCKSQETEAPSSNNKHRHSNNMWLSTLLSGLPVEVCKERAVSRVLQKLSGFAEQQAIRVRPQLFLRVLGGLEPWELCLPELCVAIQIAMEHVVQMPREAYDAWLCSRVTLPPQQRRAPRTPGEPHSGRPEEKVTGWSE